MSEEQGPKGPYNTRYGHTYTGPLGSKLTILTSLHITPEMNQRIHDCVHAGWYPDKAELIRAAITDKLIVLHPIRCEICQKEIDTHEN